MNTRVDAIIGNDARIFAPNSVILAQTVAGRASLVYAAPQNERCCQARCRLDPLVAVAPLPLQK